MSRSADWAEFVRKRRGLLFAIPAGALAVLIVIAAINFDTGSKPVARPSRIDAAQELLAPRVASPEELAAASGSIGEQTSVSLASGAWVQVADETGRLAQQYSATKLEPLQGAQLAMTEPRAMMYLKDGRVLVLSARKGVAYVPRRALESGTLEEDVVVRLFRSIDGRAIDIVNDAPSVIVNAEQAQFDGVLGEVRCAKAVRVSTDAGSFAGEGLSLLLDPQGDGLESLVVDRATEPIRMDRALRALKTRRSSEPSVVPAPTPLPTPVPSEESPTAAVAATTSAPATTVTRDETKRDQTTRDQTTRDQTTRDQTKSAAAAPKFYRLTMLGGVEVVRVKGGVSSVITGEELVAVFSLESRGLDKIAFIPAASAPRDAAPLSECARTMPHTSMHSSFSSRITSHAALAMMPLIFGLAQNAPAAAEDDSLDSVTVTFGGKLIMVAATLPEDQLPTQDDIRFDVSGPRVEVLDGRSHSRILCSRLRYSVGDEFIDVQGREGSPLTVTNPRMTLEASRFTASISTGVGRIEGAGRMLFARALANSVSYLEIIPNSIDDIARMLVSADPAASALIDPPIEAPSATDARFDPSTKELEITWKDGVDLRFAGDGDNAKLSLARFEGGVNVFGRQFELDSQTLEIMFSPSDGEQIDAIIADGGMKVRRLGGEGSMTAQRLELFLGLNSKGDTIPRRLVARTGVEARDERQTIWTESLVVGFREKVATTDPSAPLAAPRAKNTATDDLFGGAGNSGEIDIDVVEAKGGVQVLLKEGARVFADELIGDAAKRKLRLTGEDVAIIRSNVVVDTLRDLRFDDATRSARSEGPGRFRAFKEPLAIADGKVERPNPVSGTSMEATWTEALDYSEVAETRGTLDIRGDVKVRSQPSPSASDAVDAQSILLELGVDSKTKDPTNAPRTLDHFIAKGEARIESRTWESAEKQGDPKVFRVSGEHIEYDIRTREGIVVGNGAILVNMPKVKNAPNAAPAKVRPPGAIALGLDGTTRFRWSNRMAIERQYDDVFKISMASEVETLHAGLRADDSMSMRCDSLEVMVKRPDDSKTPLSTIPAKADGTSDEAKDTTRGIDLGGPAEVLGVKGMGRVFIRTPEQDIECGEFDYSAVTGIAMPTASEGRTVTIALKGQPTPIRAEKVIWDLRNGRLEVVKMAATGSR
ncbi:MAG: hypothetical protein DWI10_08495 [Planctomycetota bacterium]|nr:MAG: hypothetical protein DWI10_08495 [Planctomycetota bacterium]